MFDATTGATPIAEIYSIWMQQADNNTTSNSTVTHASIAATFPQKMENGLSIANSILYIIIYSILMAIMTGFLIKYKQDMKRNQKILYGLVFLCILTQYFGLIFRLVYNGEALWMNMTFPDYTKMTNISEYKTVLYVFSFLENLFVVFQTVNIIIVICFMQNLFLNTVKLSGAMTSGVYKALKYTINIVSLICAAIMGVMVILNSAIGLVSKMQVAASLNTLPIIVTIFLIFVLTVIVESVLFLALGIRLLLVVRKNSLNVSQARDKISFLQRPEVRISGLIIGMLASAAIQVLAAIVSVFTTSYASYLHIIDYFLQCFGILVFAVFVLLLYNPLVSYSVSSKSSTSSQALDDVKTHSERTDSAHNRTLSSARVNKQTSNLSDAYEKVLSPSTTTTTSVSSPGGNMDSFTKV